MWTDEIIVIDGGSEDDTIEAIKEYRDKVDKIIRIIKNPFKGCFNDQKNLAISLARTPWVFNLDADETIESGLITEVIGLIKSKTCDAIAIPRKNYVGKNRTSAYPDYQHRCFRVFCRFIYYVHEELVGYRRMVNAENHIIHNKSPHRYKAQQRQYYDLKQEIDYKLRLPYEEW